MDLTASDPGPLRQHRIVGQKGVKSRPEVAARVERVQQPLPPLVGEPTADGRDADHDAVGAQGQAFAHGGEHGNPAAEAEHLLHRLPRLDVIHHTDHPVREVTDHRVGGLGAERIELPVGENEEAGPVHAEREWEMKESERT